MAPDATAGSTDWGQFNVKQLWAMVDGATDQQITESWGQVSAWRKTYELLSYHSSSLRKHRESLASKWPPERNAAAAAYLAHIDQLIGSLDQTAKAASTNADALGNVTAAISTARREIKPFYDEYVANEGKLGGSPQKGNSNVPQPAPGPSPIAPGRQERLNDEARRRMATLSVAAVDSNNKMVVPPPYEPPVVSGRRDDATNLGGAPGTPRPPVIPSPRRPGGDITPDPPTDDGPRLVGVPVVNPPTTTPPVVTNPGNPPIVQPPIVQPPIVQPPGGQPLPIITPPIFPPGNVLPTLPRAPLPPPGGPLPGTLPGSAGPHQPITTPRVLPPGGVIGGPPMAGGTPAGVPGVVGQPRVNPVGGVIGHGGPLGNGPGFITGRQGGRQPGRRGQIWDPDDPWAVDRGVQPVIRPIEEPTSHDPGPGVLGLDR